MSLENGSLAALPWLGLGLYASNVLLGVGVQTRVVSTRRWRWVHHALYAAVVAGAALAVLGLARLGRAWWPLALTLAALVAMPRLRGGTRAHALVGSLGLAGYAWALA